MRLSFLAAAIAFQRVLDSLIPIKNPKMHNHRLVAEHPPRVRVPGKPNPAGTKIARMAAANAIGMRGRVRL
jgi:hypothetical protein